MDESSTPPEIPWRVIIVLTGVAVGYWVFSPSLLSSRPQEGGGASAPLLGDQDVDARLWEDPICAVEREDLARRTNGTGRSTLTLRELGLVLEESRTSSACTNGTVRVLMVMVSGGPYQNDVETRLRSRVAILSALEVAGYSPKDADHLGYFQVNWSNSGGLIASDKNRDYCSLASSNNSCSRFLTPFEVFKPCPTRRPQDFCRLNSEVMVWWLRAEAFTDHPLVRLAQLEQNAREEFIRASSGTSSPARKEDLKFIVVGPRSSTGLRDMLDEDTTNAVACVDGGCYYSNTVKAILTGTLVCSPWATAADEFLVAGTNRWPREIFAKHLKERAGIEFRNCTATDRDLARGLIHELKLRGINLAQGNTEVVLLAEWDTFYGRALPLTFMAEACAEEDQLGKAKMSFDNALDTLQHESAPVFRVGQHTFRKYGYLRGVDSGQKRNPSAEQGGDQSKQQSKGVKASDAERPEGEGQLDYVRRLADRIQSNLAADHQIRADKRQVKAFGVLGGDVYDKLVLLQALRARFKGALFFTTDMDALYLDQSQTSWCRNLLVASSFGLQLNSDDLQGDIPPFRDSYETAQFRACLSALQDGKPANNQLAVPPWIFEIGRTKAVPLEGAQVSTMAVLGASTGARSAETRSRNRLPGFDSILSDCFDVGRYIILALLPFVFLLSLAPVFEPLKRCFLELVNCPYRTTADLDPDPLIAQVHQHKWKMQQKMLYAFLVAIALMEIVTLFVLKSPDEDSVAILANVSVWLEGVSVWPTEYLRMLILLLCALFFVSASFDLEEGRLRMRKFFSPGPVTGASISGFPSFRKCSATEYVRKWIIARKECGLTCWAPKERVKAVELFADYSLKARWSNRMIRCLPLAALMGALGFILMLWLGFPVRPWRGPITRWTDLILFLLCAAFLLILVYFVLDGARLCRVFVERLGDGKTLWPDEVLNDESSLRGIAPEELGGWLDVQVVAEHTEKVGRMIYYPFVILLPLVIAQDRFLENWDWPLALILVTTFIAVYVLFSGVIVRSGAEKVRLAALEELDRKIILYTGHRSQWAVAAAQPPGNTWTFIKMTGNYAEKLRGLRKQVCEERRGAFARFLMNPAIGAVLLPSGGAVLLALIQYFVGPH